MIVAWIVKCDNCGLLVDATENPYHENYEDMGDICHYCWLEMNGEEDPVEQAIIDRREYA